MRLLTYTELTRYSKAQLWELLREASIALSVLPEHSAEHRNALLNYQHIRLFLARREYTPC